MKLIYVLGEIFFAPPIGSSVQPCFADVSEHVHPYLAKIFTETGVVYNGISLNVIQIKFIHLLIELKVKNYLYL